MNEKYLNLLRDREGELCDRCGKKCLPFEISELKSFYKIPFMNRLCDSCGKKANSFVSYYGRKKEKDLINLSHYLKSGKYHQAVVKMEFSKTMNAGYYSGDLL